MSRPHRSSTFRLLALLAAPCALSCGTDPGPQVSSVVITAPSDTVTIRTLGRQVQFSAEVRDDAGQVVTGHQVVWSASSPAARISALGLLTAVTPATVKVWAVVGSVVSAPVTVTIDPQIVGVAIRPDSLIFHTTARPQPISAEVLDSSGATLPRVATLTIADTGIARLSGGNAVVAVASGTTRLIATVDGLADTVPVTVGLLPGVILTTPSRFAIGSHSTRSVRAIVADSSSHPLPGNYPVAFTSLDTTVVTVSDSGLVTPAQEGSTGLRIDAGGLTTTVPVAVHYVVWGARILPSPMTLNTLGRPQRARLYAVDSTFTVLHLLPDSVAGRPRDVSWHAFGDYYSVVPADTGADVYPIYNGDYGDIFQMLNASWQSTLEGYAVVVVMLYPATFHFITPTTDLAVGDSTVFGRVALDSLNNDLEGRILIYITNDDWSVVSLGDAPDGRSITVTGLKPGTSWVHLFGGTAADSVLVTVH